MTGSVSALCFGSSFIGSGELWAWLQNLVGVSNQIAWFSIGLASWRFRKAWKQQGRSLDDLKFRAAWTWPWGPPFVIFSVATMIIVQGWSSIIPKFTAVDFVSFYIEIPTMLVMFIAWMVVKRPGSHSLHPGLSGTAVGEASRRAWYSDLVDTKTVDLSRDEYVEGDNDRADDEQRITRMKGNKRCLWKLYYWIA